MSACPAAAAVAVRFPCVSRQAPPVSVDSRATNPDSEAPMQNALPARKGRASRQSPECVLDVMRVIVSTPDLAGRRKQPATVTRRPAVWNACRGAR